MKRLALAFSALLALGACGTEATIAVAGATVASAAFTDKLPAEHVVEWMTGEDCSIMKSFRGQPYCAAPKRESADQLAFDENLFCYRTLGKIDCYTRPPPDSSLATRVR